LLRSQDRGPSLHPRDAGLLRARRRRLLSEGRRRGAGREDRAGRRRIRWPQRAARRRRRGERTAARGDRQACRRRASACSAAAADEAVRDALRGVTSGRALLRFTDSEDAFEFGAGEGAPSIERADKRGPGPKVDASSATWLGLMAGTIKPWLAFTRGLIACRAGLNELRWLQQVAERMQQGYLQAK